MDKGNYCINNSPSLFVVDGDDDAIYLLKQLDHLTDRIFHILDLVDCLFMCHLTGFSVLGTSFKQLNIEPRSYSKTKCV